MSNSSSGLSKFCIFAFLKSKISHSSFLNNSKIKSKLKKCLRHLPLSILKALGHVVDWLILSDRIFLNSGLGRFEFSDFRFSGKTILEFSERREKAGPVGLQLALLTAKAELDREPVALK